MRFLLYFPLPLLLILCSSFVVTNSPPINSIGDPTYTNDAFVNSSLVMNNYDAIVEEYRRKQGTRVIKPLPLESEGASEPKITENYDNLSIGELETKLKSEEGNLTELIKDIANKTEELKKKEEEAKVSLQEYEDAKKEWERLDGIYQEKKKPYTELDYKLGNATKNWNDAKEAYEKLDNMVKEQEKLEEKIVKATKDLSDVTNVDSELDKAGRRKTALATEIPDQNTILNGFSDPIRKATDARDSALRSFGGAEVVFQDNNCENSGDPDCPTYKNRLEAARTTLENANTDLDQLNNKKQLAIRKLQELKREDSELDERIEQLEKYRDGKDYLKRTFTRNLEKLKKKQQEFKPLAENKQSNETAAADFATATETFHGAETAFNEYDKAGITSAERASMLAFGYFEIKDNDRNTLNRELGAMRKHLTDLEKELDKKNVCLEGIKRKINELTAAEAQKDPATGSLTTVGVSVAVALIFILAAVLGVIMFMNRRRGKPLLPVVCKKALKKKETKEAPTTNTHNPSAKLQSDPSGASQQQNGSSSKSNQGAPATAPSNSETPPPPAANSAEAPPPAATAVPNDRDMQKLMAYLKNLDEDARMTFSKFLTLPEATETVKEQLKKFVDPNSIVRTFEKKIFIFNTEEPSGEIWIYWRGHVLRRVDARRIPLIPLDLEAPYDTPIKMCENPSKDRSQMYWNHATDNFFLVVNWGRKTLKQMLIDKALTSESTDKWKQMLLEMKNRMQAGRAEAEGFFANIWCKISQFTRKIMAWTQSEEPVDPVWLENELDQLSEFELILMYATITGDKKAAGEVSMIMHELKRVAKECRETRKAPCKTIIRSLRAQMRIVDKFLGARGEFLKAVYQRDPNIFLEDDSEEQVGLSQEGESTERSEAGSEAEDEKGSDRSSSNKDKRSPKRKAIKKQKRKEDRAGTAKSLHGERVITEDGADLPDLKHLLDYDKDGNPRKKFTTERCKAEMKRIESNAKSHDLTPQNFDDNAELLKTVLEAIAKDPKYITKEDNMESVKIGDLHGNVDSLLYVLKINGGVGTKEWKKRKYIFTGDYVDRGKKSIDLINYVFCLRILYPDNIIILRGNHECYETNIHYGFYLECQDRFKDVNNERCGKDMHLLYNYVFSHMSIACTHNGVFHAHGGMSEYFPKNLEDMNDIMPHFMWEPLRVCPLAGQLLWSDPCFGISGWEGGSRSRMFGENVVYDFIRDHPEIVMIVRAHQVMNNGQEFFAGGRLLSLFSTTTYNMPPGYPNRAAVMIATPDRVASLQHFVGVEFDVFDRFVKGLEPELRTKLIYDHNLENFMPSIKTRDFKPAEPDCKSETIRMC